MSRDVDALTRRVLGAVAELELVHNVMAENGPALENVGRELLRQHRKWGEQNHPDGTGQTYAAAVREAARQATDKAAAAGNLTWRLILLEEVWEALAETDEDLLARELEQVAAVAVQWRTTITRRQARRLEEPTA